MYMSWRAIPKSFRKYLKGENKSAILKMGNQKWLVKIDDGWGNFVRVNGVQDFDLVVFKHEGNLVFDTWFSTLVVAKGSIQLIKL